MDGPDTKAAERRRFLAALALFFLWVMGLAVMAVTTGRKPIARSVRRRGLGHGPGLPPEPGHETVHPESGAEPGPLEPRVLPGHEPG